MNAVTHLEKVITGEVSAVTHLEKVIAGETSAVTYTEKVITGEAPPITHLQKVIAGEASPVTHLEHVWAGRTPEPTEHEYTGAVPYTFRADGTPLLDWYIKGNTVQNGTPTPQNPIMPQSCGDMTGNLWDNRGFSALAINLNHTHKISNNYGTTLSTTEGNEVTITQSEYPTGITGYQNGFFTIDVDFSKYAIGDVVTISFDYIVNEIHALSTQKTTTVYAGKDSNIVPYTLSSGDWKVSGRLTATITVIADMRPYVEVRLCGNSITVKNIMLNAGSTALPYEPYSYKLDISSANTTTPIYLGEVESTRRIKKLVLTGEEAFTKNDGQSTHYLYYANRGSILPGSIGRTPILCNELPTRVDAPQVGIGINTANAFSVVYFNFEADIMNAQPSRNTVAGLKEYLAAQYAAGTPVCIWYVLATEETAVVNEPLMKIGDYADEVSNVATIPTVNGSNTFDVDTTAKPSEVYIKYKG